MDLAEAEDIKKTQQEYTEELYQKDLHDPDNHDGVITSLEPDILECEVKWALESITTNKATMEAHMPQDWHCWTMRLGLNRLWKPIGALPQPLSLVLQSLCEQHL